MVQARHGAVARSVRLSLAAMVVALFSAITVAPAGAQNTFSGTGAGASITTGTENSGFGFDALGSTTTGNSNTGVGHVALFFNITGFANTATGVKALFNNNTADANTATGFQALFSNTIGPGNTATGTNALFENTMGSGNTATGGEALHSNETGNHNTASGADALFSNTTGSNNIALGFNAGDNLTAGDNNIDIGNSGLAGESNTIRIGVQGTQTATLIAGIFDNTFSGPGVRTVVVDSNGQLGTRLGGGAPSSARYKRAIRNIGDASNGLLRLRPVSFRYKQDTTGALEYGLIAEEVQRVYPELVTHGDDGKVEGVRYEMLPALLLNEVQKLASENKQQAEQISRQAQKIETVTAQVKRQQIEALKKKDAQIDALVERMNALERQARLSKPERLAAATR